MVRSPKKDPMTYLIGQRVIVDDEIGTVHRGATRTDGLPFEAYVEGHIWVYLPSKGYASHYTESSVKPLPDGQL